jgi:hypothetical protein
MQPGNLITINVNNVLAMLKENKLLQRKDNKKI